MKANRKFVNGDEAVSPVIAVILMVAITVVLAATVYLFVSGFGSEQNEIVTASFAAKSRDMPLGTGDADTTDDVIEITYASGAGDLSANDVELFIDGTSLTWATTERNYLVGGDASFAAQELCATNPANDGDETWERGASIYLMDTSNDAGVAATDCDGPSAITDLATLVGVHQVKVVVRGQVVLDTTIEVHDNAAS